MRVMIFGCNSLIKKLTINFIEEENDYWDGDNSSDEENNFEEDENSNDEDVWKIILYNFILNILKGLLTI